MTDGAVLIRMAMAGPILVMHSFMNQRSGVIRMVMDTVMKRMEMKRMRVQTFVGHRFSIGWDVATRMGMVGPTQPMIGMHILTV